MVKSLWVNERQSAYCNAIMGSSLLALTLLFAIAIAREQSILYASESGFPAWLLALFRNFWAIMELHGLALGLFSLLLFWGGGHRLVRKHLTVLWALVLLVTATAVADNLLEQIHAMALPFS